MEKVLSQKTGEQVELFLFRMVLEYPEFLLLHRVPARGGFWQPMTGGVHVGESRTECLRREAREELGIEVQQIIDTQFSFSFVDNGRAHLEFVYGAEAPSGVSIQLSPEHDQFRWVSFDEALSMLTWDTNRDGLRALMKILNER